MFNVFKKAKLADKLAAKNSRLEELLSESTDRVSSLINKCENLEKSRNELGVELETAFDDKLKMQKDIDRYKSKIAKLEKELESTSDESLVTKIAVEMETFETDIKFSKLREFFDYKNIDIDKLSYSTLQEAYYYVMCIKDLSDYMSKNNLTIRKR